MHKVAILTDSTAYLPQALVEQYPIFVIPLKVIWQGKTYCDGVDIQASEFYTMLAQSEEMPSTSQINVQEYLEMFTRLIDEGYQVLTLPISSGISGSYTSAVQAKEQFKNDSVEVLDTKLVSMALGFQVLAAARAAQAGASLQECKEIAMKAYGHIGVYFTVETLKYLHKGGRIGGAKRLLGAALNIKPILEIRDGKIEVVESVVTRRKSIERMFELVEKGIGGRKPIRLSVFHALAGELAQTLMERAAEQFSPEEIILSEVSPVVGAHVGPGTISIAYMAGM